MNRKLVSETELISFLNAELHKLGQLENCFFASIVRLRVDDRTGCNWAYAQLQGSADNGPASPPGADRIVHKARAEYNLK